MAKMNEAKKIRKQQRKLEIERKNKTKKLMVWTIMFVLLTGGALIVAKVMSGPAAGKTFDAKEFHYEKQPSMGSKDAPVKIAEFFDFKCPSCKEFDETILPQIKKDFIDKGAVQYYAINEPIISPNEDSRTAAMAGEAVYHQDPEEFWKFYEAVFKQQGDEKTKWATPDLLVQIARQSNLKLDYEKLKKDIENNAYAADVKEDESIADKLGVNSTPTIYINGTEVSENDTFNYEAIKQIILKSTGAASK